MPQRGFDALLAVSGGADSMVMLDLFKKHFSGSFCVVTIDHQIRQNSAADAAFVAAECAKENIPCQIITVNAPDFARRNKLTLEEAARCLRHDALQKFSRGATVCFAHHASDQAETVLLRLVRGTGTAGLAAMRTRTSQNGVNYFRPMLELRREEILEYAAQNGIKYVTDETNADTRYARNYIRAEVIPRLKTLNAGAESALCRAAAFVAIDEDYLQSEAQKLLRRAAKNAKTAQKTPQNSLETLVEGKKTPKTQNRLELNTDILLAAHESLRVRAVKAALEQLGKTRDTSQRHLDALLTLISRDCGQKHLDLGGGICAEKNYGTLALFSQAAAAPAVTPKIGEIPFGFGKHEICGRIVEILPLAQNETPDFSAQNEHGRILHFDSAAVPAGAVLRPRREGDTFEKFSGGTKKLKSWLIDQKLPAAARANLICLADQNRVLLICGMEISKSVALGAKPVAPAVLRIIG